RGDFEIWFGQAGPTQSARVARCQRTFPRRRLRSLRAHSGNAEERGVGGARAKRWVSRLLRQDEFLGARRRPTWPWLHLLARWRRGRRGPDRQEYWAGKSQRHPRTAWSQGWRRGVLRRWRPERVLQIRRPSAQQGRR